jgi:hypothetical protein
VKHRHPWWAFSPLVIVLIALCGLFIPYGCGGGGGGGAPTAVPTPGNLAIAFLMAPPSGNFRSVLLNISAVRINKFQNAAINGPGWVNIPVPSLSGNGKGASPGDLQIDMVQNQTGATLFNLGGVPQGTYQTVQVVVDPNNPGTIIPACQSTNANQEGCVGYPLVFENPAQGVVINLSSAIPVSKNSTAALLLQLSLNIVSTPPVNGGFYTIGVTGSQADPQSFTAQVSGTVTKNGSPSGVHLIPLTVTAVLSGTNIVAETAPVTSGHYTLVLPAFPAAGTTYDVFAYGGGFTYDVAPNPITLVPGQQVTQDFTVNAVGAGHFSGAIADSCSGLAIPGATVELLAPRSGAAPSPAPSPTFCSTNPDQCVIVATTSTDQSGKYPLPFTVKNPTPFDEVPTGNHSLALLVSASGYSSVLSSAISTSNTAQNCQPSSSSSDCSFSLPTSFINGTVSLTASPPPGSSVQVQVFAENSGTNDLVGALPMPLVFTNQVTTLPFTMNVPSSAPQNFDLFAAAIDPYLGFPEPFPGHNIQVVAAVPGAAACQTSGTVAAIPPLDCTGHGSITGTVNNGSLNTTIEVSKGGVQIIGTAPDLFSSNAPQNNAYTLCVPPDTYTLQRLEGGTPVATQTITVPVPAATSTPCPSTCSSDSDQSMCPGQCNATLANPF